MFEDQQEALQELLNTNSEFKELYEQHQSLKETVRKAETGVLPMEKFSLDRIKKEKLLLKDKMATILSSHRSS